MTLHEAIQQTLLKADRPMTAREVADSINLSGLYSRKDGAALSPGQVTARISTYPELFDYVQGEIILTQHEFWTEILRSHKYLQDLLRVVERGDKEALVVFLLFYKRISDLSHLRSVYSMPDHGGITSLRNSFVHSGPRTFLNQFNVGIEYLSQEFPLLTEFFRQQFEIVSRLDHRTALEILNVLNFFETTKLEDGKFGRIFEHLVQKSFNQNKDGYYFTPQPVAELFGSLVSEESFSKVYDPCAGLGSLLTEINKVERYKHSRYFANDINSRVASLGSLNLILNGIKAFDYRSVDCLSNPFDFKFDLIVSDLPLLSRLSEWTDLTFLDRFQLPTPPKKGGTAALVLFILSKLREGGKAFVTVSESFLYRKGYDEVARRFFVDNGLLDAVISLPPNALNPYTSIKVSILCFGSGSTGVKFIKGTTSLTQAEDLTNELGIEDIVRAFKSGKIDGRNSTFISNSDLRSNEYNLSADQYGEIYRETDRLLQEGTAQHLGSLVSIKSGASVRTTPGATEEGSQVLWEDYFPLIPIIKTENLKKEILDLKIVADDLISVVDRDESAEKSILTEKCLLIARIGDNPKPTIFDPDDYDEPIAIHRGVYALVPNQSPQVSVEYLYYQFYSPFVQQQLTDSQIGATIPYLSISSLKRIVIPVVDVSEQKKFVSAQRANLIQLEQGKIEKRMKELGYEKEVAEKESDIVRVLVHQLRPTFLSLNSQVEVIFRIIEKNKLEHFSEFGEEVPNLGDQELSALGIAANKPANHSLKEICDKLLKDSKDLNDKLTYVNKVMAFNLSKDDFQESGIKAFILGRIKALKVNNPLKFKIDVSGEECIVEVNKESIGELIDQLVNNAQTHAFTDHGSGNLLKFNIKANKQSPVISIDYSNNGKDFKLTLEQFISPFEKSQSSNGSGIGGYYIKRIVDAHKGTLRLNEKVKKGFALTIELPTIQKTRIYE